MNAAPDLKNAPKRYRDLIALPAGSPRFELIEGEYVLMAGASSNHQLTVGEIHRQLANQLRGKQCQVFMAPYDVRLPKSGEGHEDETTVLQPDLLVVCDRKKVQMASLLGAPDVVIEILSSSTSSRDHIVKRRLYESAGVREYWLYDPETRVLHVYRRDGEGFHGADVRLGRGPIEFAAMPGVVVNFDEVEGPDVTDEDV
jgi:Uma2 family endonuclease